ncbi:hypothetical protein [Polyangium jinanense]|uniref:Uncharacterized protein n=1 Tax=Polyangium jinanense TaxID=2829994 RepID=A0A9X3XFF6_9BACT|nr:hypothetical protein [Polyangium jinanense]MDC3957025.1 hypothetical protein [Polyangium jinanense]MDC3987101.1 hypothetical protein [Polyangium jinanense]
MADPDLQKAYGKYLLAAKALPAADILPYRLDPDLALVNVTTCMKVVHDHQAAIPTHLPKIDLASLLALPELALATKYAALIAAQEAPSESQVLAKLSLARDLRVKLLSAAKAIAENGLVPQAEVDAIAAGRGVRDRAEDCVSLASLFRKHAAAISGKHPVTVAQIDEAAEVGSWLVANLRPADAPPKPSTGPTEAVDLRNRFATLLARAHARLQVVAHYFHEDDWEERAPALGSRRLKPKSSDSQESTTAAPAG